MERPLAPTALTILYTGRLRGNLDRLPMLYTFLRDLRAGAEGAPVLLVDTGESCAPEAWHCAVTGGRSTLIALDGMGYHAARTQGVLTPDLRDKLTAQVQMALVDAGHPWSYSDAITVIDDDDKGADGRLMIALAPADETSFDGRVVRLGTVEGHQVGRVRLRSGALDGHDVFDLPSGTPPDPTIAGVVDFIVSEARYTEKRRGKAE